MFKSKKCHILITAISLVVAKELPLRFSSENGMTGLDWLKGNKDQFEIYFKLLNDIITLSDFENWNSNIDY